MSDYIRTTRECSVSELHPDLLQAIQSYFQEHALGNLQADVVMCCETISRKKSARKSVSWLDGKHDTIIYMGMLFTSRWLIWVHHGDQTGTRVNTASLNEIQAEFYIPLLTKDAGLKIVGFVGDNNTRINGYIGMGNDPAAQKFCEEVKQAILKANPPQKKDMFKWLSR
jgi:hypothetical protein